MIDGFPRHRGILLPKQAMLTDCDEEEPVPFLIPLFEGEAPPPRRIMMPRNPETCFEAEIVLGIEL